MFPALQNPEPGSNAKSAKERKVRKGLLKHSVPAVNSFIIFNNSFMKNIFFLVAAISFAAACQRAMLPTGTQVINTEIKNANGQLILAGHASPAVLGWPNYKNWFDQSYNTYSTDTNSVLQLRPLLKGKTMEIFLGSWCGDSRREVPRMLKILQQAGVDTNRLALIFVDNAAASYKQSPQHEEQGKNIHHVPTFIVYEGKKELGRIIESPVLSLEKDLLSILKHESYHPNYQAIAYWQENASGGSAMDLTELQRAAAQLKPIVKYYGEFAGYANMLLAAGKTTEALNVFQLNSLLFPESASALSSLADVLIRSGRTIEAATALERALALKPGDEELKKRIAALKH